MKALVCLCLFVVALVAAGLSYYAFVESRSVPWGAGYAAASLGALVLAVTVLSRRTGNGTG